MPAVLLAPQFLFAQATLSLIKKSQWSDYLKALLPPSAPRRAFTAAQKGQSFFFFFSLFLSLRRLARWCTLHLLFQAFNSATFDSLTHFFLNISYHSIKLSPNELSWDCNSPQAIAAEKFSLFCACYLLFPRRVTNIRASYFRVRVHVFTVGDSADEFPRKAGSSSIFLV